MFKTQKLDFANVRHGFMTRQGGLSTGIYASQNCGLGSNDVAQNVLENRARVVQKLGLGQAPLVTCHQIHSASVVNVVEPWLPSQAPQADAMVTKCPNIVLGILTADCVPVLFADPIASVVGGAHAGWKGAVGGVLPNTIAAMVDLGAKIENIYVAIGPCIHQESYEVGADLRTQVLKTDAWAERFFKATQHDHYQFDLPGYVAQQLVHLSLTKVETVDCDTYGQKDQFFSYRRTTHNGGGDYGRQISVIGLGPV